MPINYKDYPVNWKTEIVPGILKRADNKCEKCQVPNHTIICRGVFNEKEAWQDDDGNIFSYPDRKSLGQNYVGFIRNARFVRIVLTVAHLDHDINNNDDKNLRAWCQMCHNRHDIIHRLENRTNTLKRKKKQYEIDFTV